ncbi:sugar phosphate isomerase/epimerase family protein [Azospirillum halopraeferens]|uniref:sugar phosphate isomerase/epimerase family protein n=1 Tax=Azospirillum halopraeferens TaxID=34010 RepID=UPI0003FD9AFA|nr:sugar phosphate isomerase/epimerase [Azospirillum halopraeferens]
MKIHLCNEVLRHLPFEAQAERAAALGYDGLEIAPFTLGPEPHRLPAGERQRLRRAAADAGLSVVGLHWLLVTPEGLSITDPDAALRRRTAAVLDGLAELCADLGGRVMVHGSPLQRRLPPGEDAAAVRRRAVDLLAGVAGRAARHGITWCLEPLGRHEDAFANTVAEAAALVEAAGVPALRTMIDTGAAALSGDEAPDALARRWVPRGLIGHVQVSDRNRRGPGEGGDRFAPLLRALRDTGYAGAISVEPFVYQPDGEAVAARCIGYLRGILDALDTETP